MLLTRPMIHLLLVFITPKVNLLLAAHWEHSIRAEYQNVKDLVFFTFDNVFFNIKMIILNSLVTLSVFHCVVVDLTGEFTFNTSKLGLGSLMYLTASRPNIMFAVSACARFQVTPMTSHLLAVKRIFRYLKGKPTLSLWYSRDSSFELVAYTDSDYVGATQDRKSTTGELLIKVLMQQIQYLVLKCQDTILGDVNAQTRFEITSKQSIDLPLSRGYTLGSGEDSMKLIGIDGILYTTVIKKQKECLGVFSNAAQLQLNTTKLKLKEFGYAKDAQTRRSIEDIDADVDVTLVDETQERQDDDLMFDTGVLEDDEMHVEAKVDGKDEQEPRRIRSSTRDPTLKFLKDKEKESKEKKEEDREETTKGSRKKMLKRKRAGKEQQKESSKKQKVKKEKELKEVDEAELKKLLVIKKDEDIAIDAIPLLPNYHDY
ncbi:hypothetical protein Tco_0708169 [Tanacetum coccineum]